MKTIQKLQKESEKLDVEIKLLEKENQEITTMLKWLDAE